MLTSLLELKEVVIYQDKKIILSNVNLEIKKGGYCYLIGKTGSGKSSLMKTLYADLPLKKGHVNIMGFDLTTMREKDIPQLRRKLGIVFQDFKLLLDRDVYSNLEFVLRATGWRNKTEIEHRIDKVLDMVGLPNKIHAKTFELSGGEQQRVAIARALLNDPELILADEPTGNLDPRTSIEIMNLLNEIHEQGTAILMATHDYSIILKYEHPTVKCEDGKLFEVVRK